MKSRSVWKSSSITLSILILVIIGMITVWLQNPAATSSTQIEPSVIYLGQSNETLPVSTLISERENISQTLLETTARGGIDAPITVVEYGGYGNGICQSFNQAKIMQTLMEKHPGQIRYYFVSFPLSHPNAKLATEATLCALEQDKKAYWSYHETLLDLPIAVFNRYSHHQDYIVLAGTLGLEVDGFERCLYSGKYQALVYEMVDEGKAMGFTGDSRFLVNHNTWVQADRLEGTIAQILDNR